MQETTTIYEDMSANVSVDNFWLFPNVLCLFKLFFKKLTI